MNVIGVAQRAGAGIAGLVLLGTLAGCATETEAPQRDDNGIITQELQNADVLLLQAGDCLNVKPGSGTVTSVGVVPCDHGHLSEIYATFDHPDADAYPGSDELTADAGAACLAEFEGFAGIDYDESQLEVWPLSPSEEGWAEGDRTSYCLITNPGQGTTGSLAGAAV